MPRPSKKLQQIEDIAPPPNTPEPSPQVIVEDKPIEFVRNDDESFSSHNRLTESVKGEPLNSIFVQPKKIAPKVKSVIPPVMLRRANDPAPEDVKHFIQTSIDYPMNKTLIELLNSDKKQITKISILVEFDNDHKNMKTINLI
jgi:hypothetical protein